MIWKCGAYMATLWINQMIVEFLPPPNVWMCTQYSKATKLHINSTCRLKEKMFQNYSILASPTTGLATDKTVSAYNVVPLAKHFLFTISAPLHLYVSKIYKDDYIVINLNNRTDAIGLNCFNQQFWVNIRRWKDIMEKCKLEGVDWTWFTWSGIYTSINTCSMYTRFCGNLLENTSCLVKGFSLTLKHASGLFKVLCIEMIQPFL